MDWARNVFGGPVQTRKSFPREMMTKRKYILYFTRNEINHIFSKLINIFLRPNYGPTTSTRKIEYFMTTFMSKHEMFEQIVD